MSTYKVVTEDELYHHGIIGQKWGVRRFQNRDGSLTEAGRKRIRKTYDKEVARTEKKANVYKTYSEQEKEAAETLRKEGRESGEVLDKYVEIKSDPTRKQEYINKGMDLKESYEAYDLTKTILFGKDYMEEKFIKTAILDEAIKEHNETYEYYKQAGEKYAKANKELLSMDIDKLMDSGDYKKLRATIKNHS